MRKLAIIRINLKDHSHDHLYVMHFPSYQDHGFYRQTMSLNAFFHGYRKRPNKTSTHLYVYHEWREFEAQCERTVKWDGCHDEDDRKLRTTELNGIWEFYQAIGYDYKTKRYKK